MQCPQYRGLTRELKLTAATVALGLALATAPITIASNFALDVAFVSAKSDKSNGKGGGKSNSKGGSKSKSSSGSKSKSSSGGRGSNERGGSSGFGSSAVAANKDGGNSAGGDTASNGKPKRTNWTEAGQKQHKADLAAWKAQRRSDRSVASLNRGEKAQNGANKAFKGSSGTPNSLVRQYALANGLRQGDVASALKSWNSLNRNPQAFLNNADNLKSLPGLQFSYVRASIGTNASLEAFVALGGNPDDAPTMDEAAAAQAVINAQAVLDSQAVLDARAVIDAQAVLDAQRVIDANAVLADPASTPEQIGDATAVIAAYSGEDPQTVLDGYTGEDPQTVVDGYTGEDPQTVVDGYTGEDPQTVVDNYTGENPQTVVDGYVGEDPGTVVTQYAAWTDYETSAALAEDAFMAASVSYSRAYDEATMAEVRQHVDGIIELGGLDKLVAEYDAPAEEDTAVDIGEAVTE